MFSSAASAASEQPVDKMAIADMDPWQNRTRGPGALFDLGPGRYGQVGHGVIGMKHEEGIGNIPRRIGQKAGDGGHLPPVDIVGDQEGRRRQDIGPGDRAGQAGDVLECPGDVHAAKRLRNPGTEGLEIELHRASALR